MKTPSSLSPGRLAALIALTACCFFPSVASAQIPRERQTAIGFAAGAAFPFEGSVSTGYDLGATFDYYLFSNQAGLRGTLGYTHSGTDLSGDPSRSVGYLTASAFYRLRGETLAPYVVGGIGLYTIDPPYGSMTVRFGLHAGAGVEFFIRRRVALTGEALVHGIGSVEELTSSYVSVKAGIRYFF